MRKLTQQEIITELLRTYQDITSTLNAATDWIGEKPGSRVLCRPDNHPYFTGSYRQLEDVLRFMRDGGTSTNNRDRKKLQAKYWAVNATYLLERRTIDAKVQRKTKNHKTVTMIERQSVPITNKPIPKRDLEAGEAWIAQEFRRRRQLVQLPPPDQSEKTKSRAPELHEHAAA